MKTVLLVSVTRFFPVLTLLIVFTCMPHYLAAEESQTQEESQLYTVTFRAYPAGARLFVNELDYGIVPQTLNLAAGEYEISLDAPRLHPLHEQIEVKQDHIFDFELRRRVGTVFFQSDPPDAHIIIDGIDFGHTPRSVRLFYGPHEIEYKHDHYEWHVLQFEVWDDFHMDLPFTQFLEPAFLSIEADSIFPAGEEVILNGEYIGHTPVELYPVYGSSALLSISGHSQELQFESGRHYTIVPYTPVPLTAAHGSIHVPGYQYTDAYPDMLPEERLTERDEVLHSYDRSVLVSGSAFSILAGLGTFAVTYQNGENMAASAAIGAGAAVLGQLMVFLSARERKEIPAYTYVPLDSNKVRNERVLSRWNRRSARAEDLNRELITEINQSRGEWKMRVSD